MGLLFTYILTYGGAAVSLFNPFVGLLVYVCFSIIKPESLWFWSVPEGNYSRIVAIAMLLGWVIHLASAGITRRPILRSPRETDPSNISPRQAPSQLLWQRGSAWDVALCFIAFWLWAVVSGLNAPNTVLAFDFVEAIGKILLPFLVGITTVNSVGRARTLVWVMTLSEAYVAWEMNLSYFQGYNRIYFDGFGGMDNNSLAISFVTGVGLAFFLGYAADKWWQTGIALLAALIMLHAVFLSFSRGGMLALVVMAGVSFILIPKRPKHYLLFLVILLIGFRLAGNQVISRFDTIFVNAEVRDSSAQSRLDLWADLWDVMQRNPVLGVGPHHWPVVAPDYGWPPGKEGHSLWLQTGAELGFPGLALLVLFYGLCITRLWPLSRSSLAGTTPWDRDAAQMVIAALLGFAIAAQFVSLWALEIPYYVVLIGAATLRLSSEQAVN